MGSLLGVIGTPPVGIYQQLKKIADNAIAAASFPTDSTKITVDQAKAALASIKTALPTVQAATSSGAITAIQTNPYALATPIINDVSTAIANGLWVQRILDDQTTGTVTPSILTTTQAVSVQKNAWKAYQYSVAADELLTMFQGLSDALSPATNANNVAAADINNVLADLNDNMANQPDIFYALSQQDITDLQTNQAALTSDITNYQTIFLNAAQVLYGNYANNPDYWLSDKAEDAQVINLTFQGVYNQLLAQLNPIYAEVAGGASPVGQSAFQALTSTANTIIQAIGGTVGRADASGNMIPISWQAYFATYLNNNGIQSNTPLFDTTNYAITPAILTLLTTTAPAIATQAQAIYNNRFQYPNLANVGLVKEIEEQLVCAALYRAACDAQLNLFKVMGEMQNNPQQALADAQNMLMDFNTAINTILTTTAPYGALVDTSTKIQNDPIVKGAMQDVGNIQIILQEVTDALVGYLASHGHAMATPPAGMQPVCSGGLFSTNPNCYQNLQAAVGSSLGAMQTAWNSVLGVFAAIGTPPQNSTQTSLNIFWASQVNNVLNAINSMASAGGVFMLDSTNQLTPVPALNQQAYQALDNALELRIEVDAANGAVHSGAFGVTEDMQLQAYQTWVLYAGVQALVNLLQAILDSQSSNTTVRSGAATKAKNTVQAFTNAYSLPSGYQHLLDVVAVNPVWNNGTQTSPLTYANVQHDFVANAQTGIQTILTNQYNKIVSSLSTITNLMQAIESQAPAVDATWTGIDTNKIAPLASCIPNLKTSLIPAFSANQNDFKTLASRVYQMLQGTQFLQNFWTTVYWYIYADARTATSCSKAATTLSQSNLGQAVTCAAAQALTDQGGK